MLIFQLAQKPDEKKGPDFFHMKLMNAAFMKVAHDEAPTLAHGPEIKVSEIEKAFRKEGLSAFMSTLTPGAKNAIFAASFAWGLENGIKYVRNAMKLAEVNNAIGTVEKSKAVVESVAKQAGQQMESKHTTKIAWSFYNEDMKESLVMKSESDTLTQTEKAGIGQQKEPFPATAQEAVAMGIAQGSQAHPMAIIYLAESYWEAQEKTEGEERKRKGDGFAQLVRVADEKKEREARTVVAQEAEIKTLIERQKETALKIAVKRKEELIGVYEKMENMLAEALDRTEKAKKNADAAKAVEALLPKELLKRIRWRRKLKKAEIRKKLMGWIAFCRSGKGVLSKIGLGKLKKLISLFSFFN